MGGAPPSPTVASGDASGRHAAGAPRMLGRYHVLEPLSSDAFGATHLARLEGPNGFQRWATVRVLSSRVTKDSALLCAFQAGARLAARLSHPNVVTTFDVGEDGGPAWIAFEHVQGEIVVELADHLRASGAGVPWDVACKIVADGAQGAQAIAEQREADPNAVHLALAPITPARLVVGYDGKAKVIEACLPMAPDVLVLPYVAPERARGGDGDVRSEVFALGVMLWEAVAGRPLFAGASEDDTLARIEALDVPPLRSIVTCPERLEEVVGTALRRDPKDRFQTPRAFARALQTVIVSKGLVLTDDDVARYLVGVMPDRFQERQARLASAAHVTEVFRHEDVDRALSLSRQRAIPASSTRATEPNVVPLEPQRQWAEDTAPTAIPETKPSVAALPVPGVKAWDDVTIPREPLTGPVSLEPRTLRRGAEPDSAASGPTHTWEAKTLAREAPLAPESSARPTQPFGRRASGPGAPDAAWEESTVPNDPPTVPLLPESAPKLPVAPGLPVVSSAGRSSGKVILSRPTAVSPKDEPRAKRPALAPLMEPIGGSSMRLWGWVALVVGALFLGAVGAWTLAPHGHAEPAGPAEIVGGGLPAAVAPPSAVVPLPMKEGPVVPTAPATATATAPPVQADPLATAATPATSPAPPAAAAPRHPTAPHYAGTGRLTVICLPACDQVIDNGRSLGSSPVFKATAAAGAHRLRLKVTDPPAEKTVEVEVTAGETTVVRQPMTE